MERNVFEAVAMQMTQEISQLTDCGLEETHNIIGVNHVENENMDSLSTRENSDVPQITAVAVRRKRNWEQSATIPDSEETLLDPFEDTESVPIIELELQYTNNTEENQLKQKIEECKNCIGDGGYDKFISKPSSFDDSVWFDEHLERL